MGIKVHVRVYSTGSRPPYTHNTLIIVSLAPVAQYLCGLLTSISDKHTNPLVKSQPGGHENKLHVPVSQNMDTTASQESLVVTSLVHGVQEGLHEITGSEQWKRNS